MMENIPDNSIGDRSLQNTILCLSCMKENDGAATVCRYCNRALGLTENPDPLQRLSAEGAVYAKAVEVKPNIVILVGVWLLFFPALVMSLPSAVSILFYGEGGSPSFIMFWVLIIVGFFSLAMLYKVTKNYVNGRKND